MITLKAIMRARVGALTMACSVWRMRALNRSARNLLFGLLHAFGLVLPLDEGDIAD
jgi:hypothetical protein